MFTFMRHRTSHTTLLVVLLTAAAACDGTGPTSPTPVDARVTLAPGQTAAVTSGVEIRFIGVTGDSRCPADALCILGGDAIVRIEIRSSGRATERELHTGNNAPVAHRDLHIALVQLDPYPFSAHPIDPADYRATLRIVRQP